MWERRPCRTCQLARVRYGMLYCAALRCSVAAHSLCGRVPKSHRAHHCPLSRKRAQYTVAAIENETRSLTTAARGSNGLRLRHKQNSLFISAAHLVLPTTIASAPPKLPPGAPPCRSAASIARSTAAAISGRVFHSCIARPAPSAHAASASVNSSTEICAVAGRSAAPNQTNARRCAELNRPVPTETHIRSSL